MQHHGLPTRLLDWSTTFAAALHFALRDYISLRQSPEITSQPVSPCVWILDPFELNRIGDDDAAIANPYTDFNGTYYDNFIADSKGIEARVVAISPPQHTPRQGAQRSVFTLHADLTAPLNNIAKGVAKKFDIPVDSIQQALTFLNLAGVNEFSLFPDLDGLARHLKQEHISWF